MGAFIGPLLTWGSHKGFQEEGASYLRWKEDVEPTLWSMRDVLQVERRAGVYKEYG
jgi:hypothetical protein